jgi:hypothetical protein
LISPGGDLKVIPCSYIPAKRFKLILTNKRTGISCPMWFVISNDINRKEKRSSQYDLKIRGDKYV